MPEVRVADLVEAFSARHPDAVRLGGPGPGAEGGGAPGVDPAVSAVLVTVHDEADLRARDWPPVRSPVVGVLLGPGAGALTFDPGGDLPLLRCVTRRGPRRRWCELVFAEPVDVPDVLTRLARQAVGRDRGRLPARTGGAGTIGGGPLLLDERVHHPTGFRVVVEGPVRDLDEVLAGAGRGVRVDRAPVEGLRDARGVRVPPAVPVDRAADLATLALAGVPLVGDPGPAVVGPGLLAPAVVAAMRAPVDLDDPVAREEHSVVLRRAALDAHAAGWSTRSQPTVSVLLATRRPEMLEHALAQVGRQRGVDRLELVLAPHGFEPDPARVRALLPDRVALQVVAQPAATPFGDVLHAAYLTSGGELLLKMDDDDFYAPEAVLDLLRARAWSGAEVVGMPASWVHVTGRDVTVVLDQPSEVWARFVAGGTILVERDLLREVGGFRSVRRFVDAQLLDAVRAAGAGTYRTHGLGYVLRRNPSGHTWQAGEDEVLGADPVLASRPGLRPSRLVEIDFLLDEINGPTVGP